MSYVKKMSSSAMVVVLAVAVVGSLFAADEVDYKSNLKSDSEEVVIEAIQTAGAKKDAETLDTLIEILKNNPNPKIRMEAAQAIGKMEVKDKPVNALSDAVKTDKNDTVVYASLLSMTNLTKVEKKIYDLPAVLEAVDYCRKNKTDDVYINDLVTKYDKLIANEKSKK